MLWNFDGTFINIYTTYISILRKVLQFINKLAQQIWIIFILYRPIKFWHVSREAHWAAVRSKNVTDKILQYQRYSPETTSWKPVHNKI